MFIGPDENINDKKSSNYFSTSAGKNIALSNEEAVMRIVTFSSGSETEYDEDDSQSDNSFQL